MAGAVKTGNKYKYKTKKYYEKLGYTVEYTEFNQTIRIKDKLVYRKTDVLESDGIAYNDKEFIIWNSIYNINNLSAHRERYKKLIVPNFIKKVIAIWLPRAKEPVIEEVIKRVVL